MVVFLIQFILVTWYVNNNPGPIGIQPAGESARRILWLARPEQAMLREHEFDSLAATVAGKLRHSSAIVTRISELMIGRKC